jgi:hypothetical protein
MPDMLPGYLCCQLICWLFVCLFVCLFVWLFVYDLWLAAYAGVAGYAVWLTNLAAYPRWF